VSRPAERDVPVYLRDHFRHELRFVQLDGTSRDVSAAQWLSQVRRRWSDATVDAVCAVDVSQAAQGVVVFTIPAATVAGLEPGVYRYDVQWSNYWGAGEPLTVLRGRFEVTGDISRV
jgi:hypothetical protein